MSKPYCNIGMPKVPPPNKQKADDFFWQTVDKTQAYHRIPEVKSTSHVENFDLSSAMSRVLARGDACSPSKISTSAEKNTEACVKKAFNQDGLMSNMYMLVLIKINHWRYFFTINLPRAWAIGIVSRNYKD